jgi:hypothetical protein
MPDRSSVIVAVAVGCIFLILVVLHLTVGVSPHGP